MSNINIVYATMTKHSKKLAEAIGTELNVKAQNVKENVILDDTDMLFIVGGLYSGDSLPILLEFSKNLDSQRVKKAVLITSSVSKKKGQDSIRKILVDKGIEVMDEFFCYGSFLFFKFGHPNKDEIQQAVNFALKVIKNLN